MLFITFPAVKHEVTLRIFDREGNFSEKTIQIKVSDLDYGAYFLKMLLPAFSP